jgi:putative ABC transport system permease protein
MNWWQRFWHGNKMDEQLDKELRFHLDQQTQDLIARGIAPEEARRQVHMAFGGPAQVAEDCREARGTRWLEDLLHDFRYALRMLRNKPAFTLASVITLALGIGASAAIFSAVDPILFEPLPYPHANRIMMIWDGNNDGSRTPGTFGAFRSMVEGSKAFESLAVMKTWEPTVTGEGQPERLEGQNVSADYFRVLGVTPAIGRDFQDSDDQFKGPSVAILSDGLWRRRFNADRGIVGQQVKLDGDLYTVIGVMPDKFENVLAPEAQLWSPLQYDRSLPPLSREWGHHLRTIGRLQTGVTNAQAGMDLNRILHNLASIYSRSNSDYRPPDKFLVTSLQDDVTRSVRPALLVVLGAVLLVLMIACVNVTNLLLARSSQRRAEFAMRTALGAARSRLMRQLLTESLLLAAVGGIVGMLVAKLGVTGLVALSPAGLPRANAIGLNGSVFLFGLILTTLTGLLVGMVPAWQASHDESVAGLHQSSRRGVDRRHVARRTLVVTEISLALVLLVGAGLLLRSLHRLFAVDSGFNADHLLTMQVQTSGHQFDDDNNTRRFYTQSLEAVKNVPGVLAAAYTSQLPLSGELDEYGVHFDPGPGGVPEGGYSTFRYGVTPGYLETMQIPLLRGRLLNEGDIGNAPHVVLISESLARLRFRGENPIGHRVHVGRVDLPWYTIVGEVGNVKQASLAVAESYAIYVPAAQWYFADSAMSLVVRARGDAAALAPAVRNAVWSIDKDQPIVKVATMDRLIATTASERLFVLIMFEAFGLVALILAATGIYGVLSGNVTARIREIGVRAALGASRSNILALVLRQGMTLTCLGIVIGIGGAVLASKMLATMLFGISHLDPVTYFGVILLLSGVSVVACWMPAWRASRVDPSITLRSE